MQTDSNPITDHVLHQSKVLKTMLDTWLPVIHLNPTSASWEESSTNGELLLGIMYNSCFELQFVSGTLVVIVADLLETVTNNSDTEVDVIDIMGGVIESWLNASFRAQLACELLVLVTEGKAASKEEFVKIAMKITERSADDFTKAVLDTFKTAKIPKLSFGKMTLGKDLLN